ncbi:hypothetical protein F8388_002020 [Cannabis sativa]|uniref:Zinc knuckle CX2CX4HX4C domain-containing protein n=1 Tax=Cannabis sativa TaxID=3483 RepID=A0A7J6FLA8_CANSA|nr:hypothetical protein F8388_002020 [Cannabis sativa]
MFEAFAREWGSLIGKVEDVRVVNKIMKVCVCINITRPFKRGLRVSIDEKSTEVSLLFQYEHLPEFCDDCDIIGHKTLDFPLKDYQDDEIWPIQNGRYGSCMCAPSSPPRNRGQRGSGKHFESQFMNMREAGRIMEVANRSRLRRNTEEEFVATSISKSREREEELRVNKGVTLENEESETTESPLLGEQQHCPPELVLRVGESHGPIEIRNRDKGRSIVYSEVKVGKLFQSTFGPMVKTQKKKTWKRRTTSLNRHGASILLDGVVATQSDEGEWPSYGVKRKNDVVGTIEERIEKPNIPSGVSLMVVDDEVAQSVEKTRQAQ